MPYFTAATILILAFPEPAQPSKPTQSPSPESAQPSTTVPPTEQATTPKRKINRRVFGGAVAVGLVGSFFLFRGSGLMDSGYRRGFGDTILSYKNRSYEGAKWEEVKGFPARDQGGINHVIGWQDDDYWVLGNVGILRYKKGTWRVPYGDAVNWSNTNNAVFLLLLDQNTLVFGKEQHWGDLAANVLKEDGSIVTLIESSISSACPYYADHGLLYLVSGNANSGGPKIKVSFRDIKTLGSPSTTYQTIRKEDKENFVHTEDNAVITGLRIDQQYYGHTVNALYNVVQIAPGKCLAIVIGKEDRNLVEFRNGIWYKIEELRGLPGGFQPVNAMWIDCVGTTPRHCVLCCSNGQVFIHTIGEGTREMRVSMSQETTSLDLLRVWGNNIDKFWTMDTNGTVWERNGNDWRVVVRGLRKDNIEFKDAWVSPTGTVYAISRESKIYERDEKLYRLK